ASLIGTGARVSGTGASLIRTGARVPGIRTPAIGPRACRRPRPAGTGRAGHAPAPRPGGNSAGLLLRRGAAARLVAHPDHLAVLLELEQVGGLHQVAELAVAVVARVERGLVADLAADHVQPGPAVVTAAGIHRAAQHLHQARVATQLLGVLGRGGRGLAVVVAGRTQCFDVGELGAGVDERRR